jgi:hypothetical protein
LRSIRVSTLALAVRQALLSRDSLDGLAWLVHMDSAALQPITGIGRLDLERSSNRHGNDKSPTRGQYPIFESETCEGRPAARCPGSVAAAVTPDRGLYQR